MVDVIRVFPTKFRLIFCIFKKGKRDLPSLLPTLVAFLWVWLNMYSLNMPKYPWKYLTKLLCLCQGSEYAWSSYLFDRLLKMPPVLNKPGFWTWSVGICKVLCRVTMAPYASVTPEYPSICLNVPQYAWTWLNVAECTWINCFDYWRFSICCDIVIITLLFL